ncbi:MAG: S-layer homology domain-containing protein [Clostridia bacterium]|nr:S-layer homology domain-containing protein [Clostridia bacterium]
MKKCIAILALLLSILMVVSVFGKDAEAITADDAAERLHALGLLAGVGNNADGSVNFDTNGSLTRAQSITQVVRFLGKEKAATSNESAHPFTDLPAWAVPYVGYAYANGVTKGVSNTKFAPDNAMTEAAFLTAILRVLEYDDAAGDFVWNAPYDLAKEAGLLNDTTPDNNFTRGDAFVICYRALSATTKSGGASIAEQLITEGLFTMEKYNEVCKNNTLTVPEDAKTELVSITDLKQNSVDGDHANDDYRTASLEINYRENVVLTSAATGYSRYDKAYYPRVKKLRDDFYVLLYHFNETGPHLYYATSNDGINWNAPEVLFNQGHAENKFTYTYGKLEGQNDSYWGVNVDGCVLEDGTLFCVYAKRPCNGYRYYPELSGLYSVTATVDASGKLVWGEHKRIYTGQVWEPGVLRRSNGDIEVYFTQVGPDIVKFGYDESHRSTGTAMIVSKDNGATWTPDIQPGDTNYYHAYTVYQEYVGDLLDQYSNTERPHYNGQMPVAVELANGRTLLAVEVKQLDGKFRVSYAVSDENGHWKELGEDEEGVYTKLTIAPNSSPYVDRFPSGEVYMTHNYGGTLVGRIGAADGSEFGNTFQNAPGANGIWGSCTVVDSHRAITAMQTTVGGAKGINLYYSYLNHRVNAPKANISVDGYTNDWDGNTDALFVGSESQAQATLRTAHDDENVYFLISRLDYYLTDGDTATVCIGAGDTADYRITINLNGKASVEYYSGGIKRDTFAIKDAKVTTIGTVNNNEDKDEGAIIEIAVPKAKFGLVGKSEFPVRFAIENQDGTGSVSDTFTGASSFSTKLWPKVVLN